MFSYFMNDRHINPFLTVRKEHFLFKKGTTIFYWCCQEKVKTTFTKIQIADKSRITQTTEAFEYLNATHALHNNWNKEIDKCCVCFLSFKNEILF